MCQNCYDELTISCERCGNTIWQNDSVSDDNICLCRSCYDDHYETCTDCGRIIHHDDCFYEEGDDDGDTPFCERCFGKERHVIKSYSYKPYPVFFGNGLYLGVELEIDGGGENNPNAEKILSIANKDAEHVYIKHDGSLNNGFEIVTHPMSLDYHMSHMPWSEMLAKAVELGYRSHQSGTCGLHVHCSRTALGKNYAEQEEAIARILYFVEKNWNEMLLFSRRTESQINRWAARYGYKDSPKEMLESAKKANLGRYTCINLQNNSTIEFRMFRGTLKYKTFIAALQMVTEICNAAIFMSDDDFRSMTWQQFVSKIPAETKPQLVNYLKLKMLYVNEPITDEAEEI
jgi:hypothetical protein